MLKYTCPCGKENWQDQKICPVCGRPQIPKPVIRPAKQ